MAVATALSNCSHSTICTGAWAGPSSELATNMDTNPGFWGCALALAISRRNDRCQQTGVRALRRAVSARKRGRWG